MPYTGWFCCQAYTDQIHAVSNHPEVEAGVGAMRELTIHEVDMLKRQEIRAHGPGRLQILTAVLAAVVVFTTAGCEPEIGNDPVPSFMEFDTETGRIPEPTIAAVSQTTGLLDFSPLGIDVPVGPGACVDATGWEDSVAECEFFQYLETLDGYPTLSSMRCPANAPLDPATLTYSGAADDTVVVLEGGVSKVTDSDGLIVAFNPNDNYLYMDNPNGWEVGTLYIGAVRGYDNGVRTLDATATDTDRLIASVIYNLLKREESLLDCTPDAASPPFYNASAVVDETCKFYELIHEMFAADIPDPDILHATVVGLLGSLEGLRQGYKGEDGFTGMWDLVASQGQMPKDEVAVAWAWPTHSQTTVELQPVLGMVPIPSGNNVLRLSFKGTIDASSLVPFNLINGADATVYLMNATILVQALDNPALIGQAVLRHTATIVADEIVLTADDPFIVGDRHIIMLVAKAEGDNRPADFLGIHDVPAGAEPARPIVPSPLTVFLRSRGPLADAAGHSLVSKMDDATAASAEEGRVVLDGLFTNDLWPSLTADLIRENVVYLYAFDY